MSELALPGDPPQAADEVRSRLSPEVRTGFKVTTLVLAAVAAVTWYSVSVPGYYFMLLLLLFYGWLVVGGVWLVLAIVFIDRTGRRVAFRSRWLIGGAAVILATVLAFVIDWPLHVRFQLSRPALEGLAVEMARPTAPAMTEARSIGLFDTESLEPFDGGYRFLVKDSGFFDPGGLAYSPSGVPPNIGGEDRYYPLFGPWWIWIESW